MNEIARPFERPAIPHATTQAADGLPRLKWTLAEFEYLSDLGFFGGIDGPRERLELIDGDLVPMNAKGNRHERVRGFLTMAVARRLPAGFDFFAEPGWRPGGDRYLEPEIIVCPSGSDPATVPPADIILLVEVADTSLAKDLGVKGRLYASLGVAEYWVVDAVTLETHVHRQPTSAGYETIAILPADAPLAPLAIPGLSFAMASLGID